MKPAREPTVNEPPPLDATAARRPPLSRERVLRAAIDLADEGGLEAVSMRRLGQQLRVEAMSLYRHVASKDDVLDGLADLVMGEIEAPSSADDWKAALRRSAVSAHDVLLRHPWASGLIESRVNAGPARLRYLDAVIGILAGAGFALPAVVQAFMALDSHTYGFTLQELSWPFDSAASPDVAAALRRELSAVDYPNLVAMTEMVMANPSDARADFAFGLDLILDGLDRLRRP
jgi:AcrR family transcriptional regulator